MTNALVFYNVMVIISGLWGFYMGKKIILKQFDKDIKESDVENYLIAQVKKLGGRSEKYKTPSRRSAPDRILFFAHGQMVFVECKAPKKKPTTKQHKNHERRRAMGFKVYVVDSKPAVDDLIQLLAKNLYLL